MENMPPCYTKDSVLIILDTSAPAGTLRYTLGVATADCPIQPQPYGTGILVSVATLQDDDPTTCSVNPTPRTITWPMIYYVVPGAARSAPSQFKVPAAASRFLVELQQPSAPGVFPQPPPEVVVAWTARGADPAPPAVRQQDAPRLRDDAPLEFLINERSAPDPSVLRCVEWYALGGFGVTLYQVREKFKQCLVTCASKGKKEEGRERDVAEISRLSRLVSPLTRMRISVEPLLQHRPQRVDPCFSSEDEEMAKQLMHAIHDLDEAFEDIMAELSFHNPTERSYYHAVTEDQRSFPPHVVDKRAKAAEKQRNTAFANALGGRGATGTGALHGTPSG